MMPPVEVSGTQRRLRNGELWGLGAIRIEAPEPDWRCSRHAGKIAKGDSKHLYVDGAEVCSSCARLWVETKIDSAEVILEKPIESDSQAKLF